MKTLEFSKRLLSLGLLCAGVGGGAGCGGDYSLFNVHPHFDPSVVPNDRVPIEICRLSIQDEKGNAVIGVKDKETGVVGSGFQLEGKKISDTTWVGCVGGDTPQDLGHLSYSSSRTSGSLTFRVEAYDANNNILFSGTSDQEQAKVFHGESDIVAVDILIKK